MKLWNLELMDGTKIEMSEANSVLAKAAMTRGDKFISFGERVIATHQIKSLDKTSKEDVDSKKLLQAGMNAFKGQVEVHTDEHGYHFVKAVKVKKEVGQREFSSYYAKHPSYETGSDGTVMFHVAQDLGVPEGCVLA